jgi:hypothetical protein
MEGFYPTIVIYTCCLLIVSLSRGDPATYVAGAKARLAVIAARAREEAQRRNVRTLAGSRACFPKN